MKGPAPSEDDTAHFWADEKGAVFDPTKGQLKDSYKYKGEEIKAKENLEDIIKDSLFKKLPEKNQVKIRKLLIK
jgi:hypothetical protein